MAKKKRAIGVPKPLSPLGDRLQAVMLERGINPTDLSRKCKWADCRIFAVMRANRVRNETVKRLAVALDIPVEQLVTR